MQRWVPAFWLALAACGGGSGPVGRTVADSAGVAIVTNHSPAWAEGSGWTVDSAPRVSIGQLDGDPGYLLGTIRSAAWLANGTIAVADETAHAIRVYTPDGRHLQDVGRDGEGPGEFRFIWTVEAYRGDSMYVFDYSQGAISVFGPDLGYVRRFTNPMRMDNYWIRAALADGRFILYSPGNVRLARTPGWRPDTTRIVVLDPSGVTADSIGDFVIRRNLIQSNGRPANVYLTPYGSLHAGAGRIAWTEGGSLEYRQGDGHGALDRIVRMPTEPQPVTAEVIAAFKRDYLEYLSGQRLEGSLERMAQILEEATYPDVLPEVRDIRIDALGNVWLARYVFPGAVATHWEVFDPEGTWLGPVRTPPGLEIDVISATEILGHYQDADGVAMVRVHAIRKP